MATIYSNAKRKTGTGKLNIPSKVLYKAEINIDDEVEIYVNSKKEIVIRKASK